MDVHAYTRIRSGREDAYANGKDNGIKERGHVYSDKEIQDREEHRVEHGWYIYMYMHIHTLMYMDKRIYKVYTLREHVTVRRTIEMGSRDRIGSSSGYSTIHVYRYTHTWNTCLYVWIHIYIVHAIRVGKDLLRKD
jgi:hypothetical protein